MVLSSHLYRRKHVRRCLIHLLALPIDLVAVDAHGHHLEIAENLPIHWFSRSLAAVVVIEEASSVRERNDAEELDALA